MSRQRTLEQSRAERAWTYIGDILTKGQGYATEYASLVKSAPADIQVNGLGQTMAFWRAKGYDKGQPKDNGANAHYQLFNQVSEWVRGQMKLNERGNLLEWITKEATTDQYRRATSEAIAFLLWLKRFAEAELGGE